ncbi:hypothetical protein LR48_Vigan11g073700 [Vigna angularis]|uniref:Ubiquitin-like protease family profile domain-containing protein n=1 Tax=Phaseolus angularis TaxID=3914 RepID=A0A0L9VSG3_PHAAN|nr:hypothetical protein LR48_Vigan11g073700 [Vigna angularis]
MGCARSHLKYRNLLCLPQTHEQEKICLSEEDPVGALQQLCDFIRDEPMKVEYDADVFGRGSEVPIYLYIQDVRELASGRQELNITLIQYMFGVNNNLRYNDVYGFIDPQVIHEANDFDDITTYLISRFGSEKEIYFIPYISGHHWQLLVISIPESYAFWFCSLHKSPPKHLRQAVDWVKGVNITIDDNVWSDIVGLKADGLDSHIRDCESNRFLTKRAIYINCLRYPGRFNEERISTEDVFLLNAIKTRIPTNWVAVLKHHMIAAGDNYARKLPYGVLISKVLELQGEDVSEEERIMCKRSEDIGIPSLSSIGLKKTMNGWFFIDEQTIGSPLTLDQDHSEDSDDEDSMESSS